MKTALNGGLGTLNSSATYSEAQVESALTGALGTAGIGGNVDLDLANLGDIKLRVKTLKSFAAFNASLASDLGLPGLSIESSGTTQSTLGYTLNFGVGLDAAGFYMNTAPGSTSFSASLDTKIPGFSATTELGPLRFTASDQGGATDFNAGFTIALKDPNNDGHLRGQ
ncbi:MAG TPA: hypothetical protein VFD27_19055 [Chthoniobacteraceae bacterium]|nr:hypothetical protein [Chthoniobacteraceae bacterium]